MKIDEVIKTDTKQITELTLRSKDYWNYGPEQIEKWRDVLTIDSNYIDKNKVYKLIEKNEIIGFYAYKAQNIKTVKLDFFFIEPKFIGKGYGKIMMTNFLNRIKKTDIKRIILDADPNAVKFYEIIGFKIIGKLKSSIKDRFLPIMELKL